MSFLHEREVTPLEEGHSVSLYLVATPVFACVFAGSITFTNVLKRHSTERFKTSAFHLLHHAGETPCAIVGPGKDVEKTSCIHASVQMQKPEKSLVTVGPRICERPSIQMRSHFFNAIDIESQFSTARLHIDTHLTGKTHHDNATRSVTQSCATSRLVQPPRVRVVSPICSSKMSNQNTRYDQNDHDDKGSK